MVTFGLESGSWVESGSDLYSVATNAQGIATATFDGSDIAFILTQQIVNVSANVQKELFEIGEYSNSFIVIKRPDTFNMTVQVSSTDITLGDTVTFNLKALKNDLAWVGATFSLTAGAGQWDNGLVDTNGLTDANGELSLVWDSSSIPQIAEKLQVFILVQLVNSDLELQTITITVNPGADTTNQTTSIVRDGSNNESPLSNPLLIGGIVSVLALGAVGIILVRRSG